MRDYSEDIEFQLTEYIDGELDRGQTEKLEKRLADDPALREELRRYIALQDVLSNAGRQELEKVNYKLQRSQIAAAIERKVLLTGMPRRNLFLRPAIWSVAAAAIIVIVASLWLSVDRTRQAPSVEQVAEMRLIPLVQTSGTSEIDVEYVHLDKPAAPVVVEGISAGTIAASAGTKPTNGDAQQWTGLFPGAI